MLRFYNIFSVQLWYFSSFTATVLFFYVYKFSNNQLQANVKESHYTIIYWNIIGYTGYEYLISMPGIKVNRWEHFSIFEP